MSGRQRVFQPATTTPSAGIPVEAPESAPAPSDPSPPASGRVGTGTGGSVDTRPAGGAYPGAVPGVPRLPGADMPEHERREWRHRLRASAGKLARAYAEAGHAEDAWHRVTGEAQRGGVPAELVTAAMADAGLPVHAPA